MLSWLLRRCLWVVPMLLGITFLTFLVLDLAPVDRAKLQLLHTETVQSQQTRDEALLRLRLRYGLLERDAQDPMVVREVPVWRRYWRWLCGAIPDVLTAPHLSALFRTPIVQVPARIGAVFVNGGPG